MLTFVHGAGGKGNAGAEKLAENISKDDLAELSVIVDALQKAKLDSEVVSLRQAMERR